MWSSAGNYRKTKITHQRLSNVIKIGACVVAKGDSNYQNDYYVDYSVNIEQAYGCQLIPRSIICYERFLGTGNLLTLWYKCVYV